MSLLRGTADGAPSAALTAQYFVANTVVFKKVKAALGLDKCKRFFSAAAPASRYGFAEKEHLFNNFNYDLSLKLNLLDEVHERVHFSRETLEYFMSLDIRIFEIYGMSESSGPQLSTTNENQKLCTIGKVNTKSSNKSNE